MRIIVAYILLISLVCAGSCSSSPRQPVEGADEAVNPYLATLLAGNDSADIYSVKPPDAPDEGCRRLRVRRLRGSFGKVFNDSNHSHLVYAVAGGCRPIVDSRSAWNNGKGLVKVRSSRYIFIDSLTHSYPYLKPHAARLLEEIGERFADSLATRGGGAYRPKVTSILRTPMTVGRLRRVNGNATVASAHQYGTTFDISYSKFVCDDTTSTLRTFEDLKNLLAEIIYDLRSDGRCLVKHERRQACFHITAAPPATTNPRK